MLSNKLTANVLLVALCGGVAGCDWVDATGRESNSVPVTNITFADGEQTEVSQIDELRSIRLSVSATDEDGMVNTFQWQDNPVSEGKLSQCNALPDFNPDLAADSLSDACASDANCRVIIEQELTDGDEVDFLVSAPKLKANVGVQFELTAIDNEGGEGRQRSTFCLVAINEAPNAVEDSYTVLEGDTLEVGSGDNNLLFNDDDDEHIGNSGELKVLTQPKSEPSLARSLTLREDGGFTYVASSLPNSQAELAIDTFVYTVTDGVLESDATVTIRVLSKNDPPELLSDIPPQEVIAGVPFESDLDKFFTDPEGANLTFTLLQGPLSSSGELTLAADGVLSGTAEAFDVGSYPISIIASDGGESIIADAEVVVEPNLPVEVVSIFTQSLDLGETLLFDVSDSFEDPEGQPLDYSVDTALNGASLIMNATTGILQANFEDAGRYTIEVSANDGVNPDSMIDFVVNVTSSNVAPIFRGTIRDQSVDLGDPLTPIRGTFVYATPASLTYSMIGTLPRGVTLNETTGVITGVATQAGEFENLRIVATDPFDESARSTAFSINVVAPIARPVNTAPVFSDVVPDLNRSVLAGLAIRPISPGFTDADGDVLSYSVIGNTLPDGLMIDSVTGVISGIPTEAMWVRGLSVLATDPASASAVTDEFWILVR